MEVSISQVKPYEKNAKKHPEAQLVLLARSLREYGWRQPIVVDKDDTIIVGHGRYMAYQAYPDGIKEPWVIKADDLTPEQVRGYRLMDNKSNESDWDMALAIEELKELEDIGFDIELTGFDLDLLIEPDEKDDEIPVDAPTRAKLGDVWALGEHRVMCGDSTDKASVERLMDGKKADMVFTDPPYGMDYSGRGKDTSTKIMGDNQDPTEFYNIGSEIPERYVWGRVENYKHLAEKPRDVIIWKKNNFGMGSGYRGQYECCFYYGGFNGSDSDVWEVAKDTNYEHPTQKPIELAMRAIKNSNPNLVIDYFLGSGSTLIAAEKTGRICYGMEIDPKYADVILKRWEDFTGKTAVLSGK